jgi:acetolactate synthase I/III small subunit
MDKHILSVMVENNPGVVSRVSGLFSRRGFNIHSLVAGVTEDPNISRITIIVWGDERTIDQVMKQLNKLIEVIKIKKLERDFSVFRELCMIKVNTHEKNRVEVSQVAEIFRAKVVDISRNSMVVEISGATEKIDALIDLMHPFGIKEVVRTGMIAIERGNLSISEHESL